MTDEPFSQSESMVPEEGSGPPPEVAEGSALTLWIMAAVLTFGALFLLLFYIPGAKSEVERRGVKEEGTVLIKDSMPMGDGRTVYTVMFVYPDEKKVNHSVTNQMTDSGLWESLKVNKPVKIFYLPENPDMAYIPGAEGIVNANRSVTPIRIKRKGASALNFIAWTILLISLPVWYTAYRRSSSPRVRKPQKKAPIITRRV